MWISTNDVYFVDDMDWVHYVFCSAMTIVVLKTVEFRLHSAGQSLSVDAPNLLSLIWSISSIDVVLNHTRCWLTSLYLQPIMFFFLVVEWMAWTPMAYGLDTYGLDAYKNPVWMAHPEFSCHAFWMEEWLVICVTHQGVLFCG